MSFFENVTLVNYYVSEDLRFLEVHIDVSNVVE